MNELIYIAGPYTNIDLAYQCRCKEILTEAAATCAKAGHVVFSPITHSAPMERLGLQFTHEEWVEFDRPFMAVATWLLVLKIPGWEESRGVTFERGFFAGARKPVTILLPDDVKAWAERLGRN